MAARESAILTMTDLHGGKRTEHFNPTILERQLDRLATRLVADRKPIEELVVCMLGDVNDGTGIYPTQIHHQAITNPNQQAAWLSDVLARFFTRLHAAYKNIRIEAVPGNHGRAGKFAHEAANWDIVCYNYLGFKLKEQGIPVRQNTGDPFIRKVGVRGHRYLMYHGHGVRMYQQIPWYGITQRILRWNNSSLAPFDAALFGHFHTAGMFPINRIRAVLSGTAVKKDQWALQELGLESESLWWFFGVNEKHPITWQEQLELK